MGLMDRDYMRERTAAHQHNRSGSWGSGWTQALRIPAVVVLLAAGVGWLYLTAGDSAEEYWPAEGSLRVNINTCTREELESVPGIGAARAAQIMAGRPWASVDDLTKLAGITPKLIENLRPFIKTEGDTEQIDDASPRTDDALGFDWRSLFSWLLPLIAGLSAIALWWSWLRGRRSQPQLSEFERDAQQRWEGHRRESPKRSEDKDP